MGVLHQGFCAGRTRGSRVYSQNAHRCTNQGLRRFRRWRTRCRGQLSHTRVKGMKQDILHRKLRAGIVGGGQGSFIGAVHRIAAELDGQAEVVAGAMSADPQRAEASAKLWYLKRSYKTFEKMAEVEGSLPDGIDFVMVTVPNHLH